MYNNFDIGCNTTLYLFLALNNQLEAKKREYDELTNKYELLEDEHVKIKSQANLQKEQLQR